MTRVESGPPKQRRRGANVRPLKCGIYVNRNKIARFDRFWEEELAMGTGPFLAPDRLLDGLPICDEDGILILDQDGNSIVSEQWQLLQFGDTDPVTTPVNALLFVIQFELVVLP